MANITEPLNKLLAVDGALGAALVDSGSGLTLGSAGTIIDVELAAATGTDIMRANHKAMKQSGVPLNDLEDVLITQAAIYHIARPLDRSPELFIYVALDRSKANLGLARRAVRDAEQAIEL